MIQSSSPTFLGFVPVKTDNIQATARQSKTPAFVADVKDGYSSISQWPLYPLPTYLTQSNSLSFLLMVLKLMFKCFAISFALILLFALIRLMILSLISS